MPSIFCSNARAPVAQLVRTSDQNSEDPGSNPGWINVFSRIVGSLRFWPARQYRSLMPTPRAPRERVGSRDETNNIGGTSEKHERVWSGRIGERKLPRLLGSVCCCSVYLKTGSIRKNKARALTLC